MAATTPPLANNLAFYVDLSNVDGLTLDAGNEISAAASTGPAVTGSGASRPIYLVDGTADGGPVGRGRWNSTDVLEVAAFDFDNRDGSVFVVHRAERDEERGALFHMPVSSTEVALYQWDDRELRVWDGGAQSSSLLIPGGVATTSWFIGGAAAASAGTDFVVWDKGSAFTAKTPSAGGRIGLWAGTSFPYQGAIHAVLVYDKALSTTERDRVLSWAHKNFGAASPLCDTVLVFDGDSITEGIQDSNPQVDPYDDDFSYPAQLQLAAADVRVHNAAQGAQLLRDNTAAVTVTGPLASDSTVGRRVVFGLWGHNDIQASRTSAQMKADLDTWIASIRAADAGAIIGHGTILPSTTFSAGENTIRGEFNDYVKDETVSGPDLDFFIDTASTPDLADPSDTDYYYTDGVHLVTLGYTRLAEAVKSGLEAKGHLPVGVFASATGTDGGSQITVTLNAACSYTLGNAPTFSVIESTTNDPAAGSAWGATLTVPASLSGTTTITLTASGLSGDTLDAGKFYFVTLDNTSGDMDRDSDSAPVASFTDEPMTVSSGAVAAITRSRMADERGAIARGAR